jgi:hypothetical protein
MNTRYLFPHRFKLIGWILLIPSAIVGLLSQFNLIDLPELKGEWFVIYAKGFMSDNIVMKWTEVPLLPIIIGIPVIVGAILAGFSKEKNEDEFIAKVRLESLLWAVYLNYFLLILCFILLFGEEFFRAMEFSMFTVLIIFLIRFNFILYRNSKSASNEK